MQPGTKIATCCYCGTRAALVLHGSRHELACSNCGAPLHDLKGIKSETRGKSSVHSTPWHERPSGPKSAYKPKKQKKRKNKKKSVSGWVASEAFDFLEDLFD